MSTPTAERYVLINLRKQSLVVHAGDRTIHVGPHGRATLTPAEREHPQLAELIRRRVIAVRPQRVVNVNTASAEQLDELPDVGPATAQRIIDHRKKHGRFTQPEQIQDVSGVGPATYERIKDRIVVS